MAREKRLAHKSPASLAEANRDIMLSQLEYVRKKNSTKHCRALVSHSMSEGIRVPDGFATLIVAEAQKPKRQRDLEKARSIVYRRQNGQSVTWAELDWAKTVCAREAKLEQAELAETTATELKKQQWQEDQKRRIQETIAANRDTFFAQRMLNRIFLDEGDKSDSESESDLNSVATDFSALTPSSTPQDEGMERQKTPTRELGEDDNSSRDDEIEVAEASGETTRTPLLSPISRAIATLRYEEDPADRPSWLTGLPKPFPHSSLTALQNHEVTIRFWDNKIARLGNIRTSLSIPFNQPSNGEWMYRHLGSTMEVMKKSSMGKGKEATSVRGLWTYVVDGEEVEVKLDEWPIGHDRQPLGWVRHEVEDWAKGRALRDEGVLVEQEEQQKIGVAAGKRKSEVDLDERDGEGLEDGGENGFKTEGPSYANNGMAAEEDVMDFEQLGEDIFDEDVWARIINVDDE